jgi:hypothetical protein
MTNDPRTVAWLDQEDANLAQLVRAHRWAVQYVGEGDQPDEPPFGYTVGLFGLGHPELTLVGWGADSTHAVLGRVAEMVRGGRDLVPGELLTWPDWADLRLVVEVLPNPGEVVLVANRFYERPAEYSVPAYQLTWALPDHCFPWEGTGTGDPAVQPRPGMWRA